MNGRNRGVEASVWGLILGVAVLVAPHGAPAAGTSQDKTAKKPATTPAAARPARPQEESLEKVTRPDAEWQRILTPEQFRVLRQEGTEMAFTGKYWNNHKAGTYRCAGCGLTLFDSATKFDSGTGWPSFWQPVDPSHVEIVTDTSHGMLREEVQCARCGGHLGHRFDDGPRPTGQRYCMNSVSLDFTAAKK